MLFWSQNQALRSFSLRCEAWGALRTDHRRLHLPRFRVFGLAPTHPETTVLRGLGPRALFSWVVGQWGQGLRELPVPPSEQNFSQTIRGPVGVRRRRLPVPIAQQPRAHRQKLLLQRLRSVWDPTRPPHGRHRLTSGSRPLRGPAPGVHSSPTPAAPRSMRLPRSRGRQ